MKVPLSVLKFLAVGILLFSAANALANAPQPGVAIAPALDVVPGEALIQISADAWSAMEMQPDLLSTGRTGIADIDTRLAIVNAQSIAPVFDLTVDRDRKVAAGMDRILLVRYAGSEDPERAAAILAVSSGLTFAEPNRIAHAMLTPNDPTYPLQWAHNNTGQAIKYGGGNVGTVDCDTDTDQAWDLQTGSSSFILAIVDTGVDTGHPEFAGRVVAGYDFINNDSNPTDDNGHGTCCAGIALGAGNNGQGIAGVAWGIKLMPVKVLDAAGSGSYTAVANGVNFAADNGAKILSMSLGGGASATLQTAINYAYGKGSAIFAAAGNSNRSSLDYPAGYSNTIAVGALSPCNERKSTSSCDGEYWWGSNYGTGLDVMAPGVRIHTADIRGAGGFGTGDYITDFNGTSSATPHAAGIGALVWSQNPALTNATLQTTLQNNCDDMGTAGYDTQTGYGRMNAFRAVQNAGGGGGGGTPVTIFSEDYEINTVPGSVWSASDANATTGLDYWGDESSSGGARVHGGSWSAYCADNSDRAGQQYDNNMNADMTLINAVNVAGYTNVQISFWIWYRTVNAADYLSFQYWNGTSWVQQQRWSGSSGNWVNPVYTLTGFSTFRFRFIFFTDNATRTEGAYVDDIVLSGVPPAGPAHEDGGPVAVCLLNENREAAEQPVIRMARDGGEVVFGAYPNPFKAQTAFSFTLGEPADVRVEVVSPDGRRVALLSQDRVEPGSHVWSWNGRDGADRDVASGAYYARLIVGGRETGTKRLLLVR